MREYTQEELKEKLKTAYNVEARAGHKKDHLSINLIGTVKRGSRLYDLYEDTGNSYWYSLRFILQNASGQKGTATGNDRRRSGGRRMSKAAESYRELEKVLREAADKAAACAEVEEKENPTREEREEAEKNFMWALMKIQAME